MFTVAPETLDMIFDTTINQILIDHLLSYRILDVLDDHLTALFNLVHDSLKIYIATQNY